MANRCVLGMRIVRLDRSDDDLARVHANPNLEIDSFLGPQLLRIPLHLSWIRSAAYKALCE